MNKTRYAPRYGSRPLNRVVLMMSDDDLGALDGWAIPAGLPSRSEAIRTLIRKGIEASASETATGDKFGDQTPAAVETKTKGSHQEGVEA